MKLPLLQCVAVVVLYSAAATANPALRNQLYNKCVSDGEEKRVCACASDKWVASITPSETGTAKMFVDMMVNEKPPAPSQMMKIQPLMMRFSEVGMECASMDFSQAPEESSPSISSMLPPGTLTPDQVKAFDKLTQAKTHNEAETQIKELDRQDQQRRQSERNAKQLNQQQEDAQREQRRSRYKAEKKRVEGRSITAQNVAAFEQLFIYQQQMYASNTEASIQCTWQVLQESAGSGPSGSLMAYFVAIGGADYDQPEEYRPYMDNAMQKYQAFQNARSQCDNL